MRRDAAGAAPTGPVMRAIAVMGVLSWLVFAASVGCLAAPGEGDDDAGTDDDSAPGDDDATTDDDAAGDDASDDDGTPVDDDATPPDDDAEDDDVSDDDATAADDDTAPGDGDGDGFADGIDCDDGNADVHPGATEVCNGVDDDCDLTVDEGFDVDGDTYRSCSGDCDDADPGVHPGATEACDGEDDDCDGVADDGFDGDGDGHTTCEGDCADGDAGVHPGRAEVCNDRDDDCDGLLDEDFDGDGDGFPSGDLCPASGRGDCDDSRPMVNPEAEEVCDNHLDDDCSGGAPECRLPASMTLDGVSPDARLAGVSNTDEVGFWISAAGDVNGDGKADLLIGAPNANGGSLRGGVAYLFLGPVGGNLTMEAATAAWSGSQVGDDVGWSVAIAPDLDGDGYDDVVIGAPGAGTSPLDSGVVTIVRGPPDAGSHPSSAADGTLTGEAASDHAGTAVAGVGDTDGDGFGDLLVSAEDYGDGAQGAVYLVRGPVTGSRSLAGADATLVGEASGDNAGIYLGAAGDVNRDGYADFLIGAPYADGGGSSSGAAYLLYGPVGGVRNLSTADAKFVGETAGDEAGMCVSAAGDLDGDGYDDVLIGAHKAEGDGGIVSQGGAAYVFYGPVEGEIELGDAAHKFTGGASQDLAGYGLAAAGDVDRDGFADLLVSAPYADGAGSSAGAAYLLYGPFDEAVRALSTADTLLRGATGGDLAGFSLSAGDLDGDGRSDLAISAEGYSAGNDKGAVYVIRGRGM